VEGGEKVQKGTVMEAAQHILWSTNWLFFYKGLQNTRRSRNISGVWGGKLEGEIIKRSKKQLK